MNVANDVQGMQAALAQASLAAQAGEVPVGAVIVKDGQIIARAFNAPIATHDPCAHAEVLALRAAGQTLQNYRLDGCTLYVTVEPCAMCAGAILHARLPRVVFGAFEPKTGAAGSVLNVFTEPRLNHQTRVTGGVMAADCAAIMARFFQDQRAQQRVQGDHLQRIQPTRLRPDAVRTPDTRFENLPGYPWPPHYVSDLPSLDGLRMHYLDVMPSKDIPSNAPRASANQGRALTYVCLHGNPAWSYLYRKMIPVFAEAGYRVLAPDLIGFGKSDKPKKEAAHSFSWHRQVLLEWIEHLDLRNIVLVVQDWGGLLGLTLPMASSERYAGLLVMNTLLATAQSPLSGGFVAWRDMCAKHPEFDVARLFARGNPQMSPQECAAYMAPFPDAGHRAALRRFPPMVPESASDDGAAVSREAEQFWQAQWHGQTLMVIGAQDPVLGTPVMTALQQRIRACPDPLVLQHAGHFVPEHGEAIARAAVDGFD
jgi:tRNA(adenine34) deaminase